MGVADSQSQAGDVSAGTWCGETPASRVAATAQPPPSVTAGNMDLVLLYFSTKSQDYYVKSNLKISFQNFKILLDQENTWVGFGLHSLLPEIQMNCFAFGCTGTDSGGGASGMRK